MLCKQFRNETFGCFGNEQTDKNTASLQEQLAGLVECAKSDDREAQNALMTAAYPQLLQCALAFSDNPAAAQDITQNACIKILAGLNGLKNDSGFSAWAKKIVRHCAADYYRKRDNRYTLFSELGSPDDGLEYDPSDDRPAFQPERVLTLHTTQEVLQEVLESLSEEQHIVAVMRFYEGKPLKTIADELHIPMSTVTGRLQLAKTNIRKRFTAVMDSPGINSFAIDPFTLFVFLRMVQKCKTYTASNTLLPDRTSSAPFVQANISNNLYYIAPNRQAMRS